MGHDNSSALLDVHRMLTSGSREQLLPGGTSDIANVMEDVTLGKDEKDFWIQEKDAYILKGHTAEVFQCAWNPKSSLIASCSGDTTARIWAVPSSLNASNSTGGIGGAASSNPAATAPPLILRHSKDVKDRDKDDKSSDVTTLEWSPDGKRLATGCYDGAGRVWSETGELLLTLNEHKGPLFSFKWNKDGDRLLSGSVDKTSIVWDASDGAFGGGW